MLWPGSGSLLNLNGSQREDDGSQLYGGLDKVQRTERMERNVSQLEANWAPLKDIVSRLKFYRPQLEAGWRAMILQPIHLSLIITDACSSLDTRSQ